MDNRFDLSWDSFPNDGASAPVAVPTAVDPDEYDELFRAWCQERHESIELKLCLDEAVRLLKHLFARRGKSPRSAADGRGSYSWRSKIPSRVSNRSTDQVPGSLKSIVAPAGPLAWFPAISVVPASPTRTQLALSVSKGLGGLLERRGRSRTYLEIGKHSPVGASGRESSRLLL